MGSRPPAISIAQQASFRYAPPMPAPADPPIGILGCGHFGRALHTLFAETNTPTLIHDPALTRPEPGLALADSAPALARAARTLILCIPVEALEPALAALRPHLMPDHLILDVGSVKLQPTEVMSRLLGRDIPWCATHPLFGPAALARNERPLRAVVCPNDHHADAHTRARTIYERLGCEVIEQTPDDHDRLMAETHALAFFIARALIDIDAGHNAAFVPPSFRALAQTVETVRADAGHLFNIIQRANPHAAPARQRLLDALTRIHNNL